MKRKNKIGVIAVFVMAGILGLSGLGIAYWYQNIRDVTPQYSSASDYYGCYWAPEDVTGATLQDSVYSKKETGATCPSIESLGKEPQSCSSKIDGTISCQEASWQAINITTFNPAYCENIFLGSTSSIDEEEILSYPLDRNIPVYVKAQIRKDAIVTKAKLKIGGENIGEVLLDTCATGELCTISFAEVIPKDYSGFDVEVELYDSTDTNLADSSYCTRSYEVKQPECLANIVTPASYSSGTMELDSVSATIKNVVLDEAKLRMTVSGQEPAITEDLTSTSKSQDFYDFTLDKLYLYESSNVNPLITPFVVPDGEEEHTYTFTVEYLGEDGQYASCGSKSITVYASDDDDDDDDGGTGDPEFSCVLDAVSPLSGVNTVTVDSATITITNKDLITGDVTFSFNVPEAGISNKNTINIPIADISSNPYTLSLSGSRFADNLPLTIILPAGQTSQTYNVALQMIANGETVSCTGSSDGNRTITITGAGGVTPSSTNIAVSKTGTSCVTRVSPRNRANFTITLNNTGTTRELITSITDKLPLGFTYIANSSTMSINGVPITTGKEPTINTVGSTQELVWNMSSLPGVENGKNIIITIGVLAGPQSLSGQNQNEVVVQIPNMPTDPNTLRTQFVFRVDQTCLTPGTGIFDTVMGRVLVGVLFMIIGVLMLLYRGGYLDKYAKTPLFMALASVANNAELAKLKATDPKKYFEKKVTKD